jgi:tetratricopeptide (TPR) repeat protein
MMLFLHPNKHLSMNLKKITSFFAAISLTTLSFSQSYDDAISLLKQNKTREATQILRSLQSNDKEKGRSSLALVLIDCGNGQYEKGYEDFKIFFDNTPDPYPYFYALYHTGIFLSSECMNNQDIPAFCKKVLDDPRASCAVKARCIEVIGKFAEAENNFSEARRYYAELNDVKNWSTVGSFENTSGSGFNKDFGPLEHPESDHEFTSFTGAKVKWFDIQYPRNDRWEDMAYVHIIENAIIYSQTFVSSDSDKDVLMLVGVSGSVKVWLNDLLVLSEEEERNTNQDYYTLRVKLQKGVNRILLQTGSSEISQNNFMVRFADLNGKLIQNISSSARYAPYTKAVPYQITSLPFFEEKYFADKSEKSIDFIDELLYARTLYANWRFYETHKVIQELKEMAPASTMVSECAKQLYEFEKNQIGVNIEKAQIRKNDPQSYTAFDIRFKEAYEKQKWDQASDILKEKIAVFGNNVTTSFGQLAILGLKKDVLAANKAIDEAYEKYPFNSYIAEAKFKNEMQRFNDLPRVKVMIHDYLRKYYNAAVVDLLIAQELKVADKREVEELYNIKIDNTPFGIANYTKCANALVSLHDYDEAMKYALKAQQIGPDWYSSFYSLANIYIAKGEKDKAIEMLRRTLEYLPSFYEARQKLRSLENKRDLYDFTQKSDVDALFKNALDDERYNKEDAIILSDSKTLLIYPENGVSELKEESLTLVNSQKAVQGLKEVALNYNSSFQTMIIEKAELLKKDGTKVPAERQNNYLVFSSISIGDAVHVIYKLEQNHTGKLGEVFWDEQPLTSLAPIKHLTYTVMVPQNKKFDYKVSGEDIRPTKQQVDDYDIYTWQVDNIQKMQPEKLMSEDAVRKITVTSIPDWNFVANWYSDVSNAKTKATYDVKEKVKEILAGHDGLSGFDKAKLIYDYIEKNCSYSNVPFLHSAFVPQSASRTLNAQLGDCKDLSALFVSMAREAGLNTNLALVRAKSLGGGDNIPLPAISFDHCIAQLHLHDSTYSIEMTNKYLPFAANTPNLVDANALCIPPDGEVLANAALSKLVANIGCVNGSIRTSVLDLNEDNAVVHRYVIKTGLETVGMRQSMKEATQEDRVKQMTDMVSAEFSKGFKVDNLLFSGLDEVKDSVKFSYDVLIDNFFSEIVGLQVFRLPWTDISQAQILAKLFTDEKRSYDMDISYLTSVPVYKEVITTKIPKGYNLAERPQNVSLSCTAFNFSIKFEFIGDRMVATREFRYLKSKITKEEYPTIKELVAKVNKADQKDIALKKG